MPWHSLLNQRLSARDLPHLGALCKHIRLARGLSGTQVARLCRCRSSATITRDFEENNQLGADYFQRWLRVMQNAERVPMPLTPQQADLLAMHYRQRDGARLLAKHRALQALDFALIHPAHPNRPPALAELVEQLAQTPYPAMIMDELWFVHALNGALLRLYGIDPGASFLHRWEGWHAVASKIPADSPVRRAHDATAHFVPPTIVYFYQHPQIQQHLFTLQTRHLLHRLFAASAKHEYEIHKWADQLLAFALPFNVDAVPRVITVNDTVIVANPAIRHTAAVTVNGGQRVHYALAQWETRGGDAQVKQPAPQPVYFAADYDRTHTFHVNRWSPVADALALMPS